MAVPPKKSDLDEVALRADYESGALAIRNIARKYCIGTQRVADLAMDKGWTRPDRYTTEGRSAIRIAKANIARVASLIEEQSAAVGEIRPQVDDTLLQRVRALLERVIATLEVQDPASIVDGERWGRALSIIAKCVQGLDEIEEARPSRPAAEDEDSDELRADLERRLGALPGPEGADEFPPFPDETRAESAES